MDYTTLEITKAIIQDQNGTIPDTVAEDDVLSQAIADASRDIDRMITLSPIDSDNYFELADVVDEIVTGQVTTRGEVVAWLHKPNVSGITAVALRVYPRDPWIDVDVVNADVKNYRLRLYTSLSFRGEVQVKVSYTGGYAATPADLPGDIRRATSVLAARYYKEGRTGLGDAIGVVELGTMIYTKALPDEVKRILTNYIRPVPW